MYAPYTTLHALVYVYNILARIPSRSTIVSLCKLKKEKLTSAAENPPTLLMHDEKAAKSEAKVPEMQQM